jgi:hypothetical protein
MTDRQKKTGPLKGSERGPAEPPEYKQTPVASIVGALLVVVAITIAIFIAKAHYSKSEVPPPKIVATAIEPHSEIEDARKQEEAAAQKKAAEEKEEAAEKRIYAERLQIRNLRLKKTKGGAIEVSGTVLNAGNREVNDIVLVLYCLDAGDRPVCEEKITVSAADNVPLLKNRRRRFRAQIESAPEETKEIQPVVTDMEFVN